MVLSMDITLIKEYRRNKLKINRELNSYQYIETLLKNNKTTLPEWFCC
jgi:hypothetical protein